VTTVRAPEGNEQAISRATVSKVEDAGSAAVSGASIHRLWAIVPVLLGAAMVASNRWFTVIDDECAIIDRAAQPIFGTLRLFLRGKGQHEHPPLYDIILHGWIRLTGGEMHLLRVPSILFYVAGSLILARAAEYLGGKQSQIWVLVLVALWPYGFHFGRVAAWYSFSFFLVSLLTLSYFKYVEERSCRGWIWFFAVSLALIYANYFGWASLVCLALDFVIRMRKSARDWVRPLVGTGALLLVSYVPILAAFLSEIHHGVKLSYLGFTTVLAWIFDLYTMFVSESVAPWFWFRGGLAGLALIVCLAIVLLQGPTPARRFLLYFAALLGVMCILGIGETKRLMLIGAWLILPVGVTLGTLNKQAARRALLAALALVASVGWYGIFARDLYAAPRWIEPWEKIGGQAAGIARAGGVVIGNNPSFFFYMTYLLPPESASRKSEFAGLLPDSVRRSNVYVPQQWIAANHPDATTTLLVKGLHYGVSDQPTEEVEEWLTQRCRLLSAQYLVQDTGANWKQRFASFTGQLAWRIEVRTYTCGGLGGN